MKRRSYGGRVASATDSAAKDTIAERKFVNASDGWVLFPKAFRKPPAVTLTAEPPGNVGVRSLSHSVVTATGFYFLSHNSANTLTAIAHLHYTATGDV